MAATDTLRGDTVILRCERNHAERVVTGNYYATILAQCCLCGGDHTTRPTSVKRPS